MTMPVRPAGARARSGSRSATNPLTSALILAVLLLLWEGVTRYFRVPDLLVPPPSAIAEALWAGFAVSPSSPVGLYRPILQTLGEVLGGLALGTLIGLGLAIVISLVRPIERYGMPYITAFQSLPKIALAPLLILWFGFGSLSTLVLVATSSFFPILVNALEGFKSTENDRIDLLRAMGATPYQVFTSVTLPSAAPFIFSGLQVALVISILSAIVGEFVNGRIGLGARILSANNVLDTPQVFAILFLLGAIGAIFDLLLRYIRGLVLFWSPAENRVAL